MDELATAVSFPFFCLGLVILLYAPALMTAICQRIEGGSTETKTAQEQPSPTATNEAAKP